MVAVKRALISLSDKTAVVEFARTLNETGIEILSTGGTAKLLANAGIPVIGVADYTGFPEILDGRVKTLHPKIHGGILGRRDIQQHTASMKENGIGNIDLVCVNLYPFATTIAKHDCTLEEAIENIDIGGPTMVRSAAKNWQHVAIVTDNNDFSAIIEELKNNNGSISQQTRFHLACKAFSYTAQYEGAIANYLTGISNEKLNGKPQVNTFPGHFNQSWIKVQQMRYGENPHQQAALYRDLYPAPGSLSTYRQLQGKALSYNNIADADTAWEAVKAFNTPACVIVKHANPCGVAVADTPLDAYKLAFATDTASAFGGIIAFNCEVDAETVTAVSQQFLEVLIAPKFTEKAKEAIAAKTNVRVLEIPLAADANHFELKRIGGGLLVQTPDTHRICREDLKIVSKRIPSEQEWLDLIFVWTVAKSVKSNAIVFGKAGQTYGIGAGQTSRIDSTRIAAHKARENGFDLNGACAASDAFFPFRDGIDVIAKQGITAVIHPGGSIRDQEIFNAADEHGIAMVLTGIRHFRH